jgi:branched-chain amino acid transport system substrate-binding protein
MKYIAIAIALVILTSACTTGNVVHEETIQIGVMAPLTGEAAIYGEEMRKGIQLAYAEIPDGRINGKKVQLIWGDSKCDPKEGALVAKKLLAVDKVDLLLSTECSGPSISAAPIAEEQEKILFVAVSTSPDLATFTKTTYKAAPLDNFQGEDLATTLYNRGIRQIALLQVKNAWGEGVSKKLTESFINKGGEIILKEEFSEGEADFRSSLVKIDAASPDAVVMLATSFGYSNILRQMEELHIKLPVFSADTFKDEEIITAAGGTAEGVIFTAFPELTHEEAIRFIATFEETYGTTPGIYADYSYDGMKIIAKVIAEAGTVETESLMKALNKIEHHGATGLTQFSQPEKIVETKHFATFIVKDGAFVQI